MPTIYNEPVEVLEREDAPAQFLLHDRLYVVRSVLAHWADLDVWRVEATAGRGEGVGVFDLCHSSTRAQWTASRP